jgi:hypothetical protein
MFSRNCFQLCWLRALACGEIRDCGALPGVGSSFVLGLAHICSIISTDCFSNDYFIAFFKGRNTSRMARLDVILVAK